MNDNASIIAKAIGSSVGYYPAEVITMLKRNGYSVTIKNSSSKDLIDLVIYALQNSKSFRDEFEIFVKNNQNALLNDYLGATAEYINMGVNLFGKGLDFFGGQKQADAIRAQANAQAQSAQAQLQIAQINQQTELAKLEALKGMGSGVPAKSNTGLYIGLGVGGAVILGLVVYLAVKK